MSRELNREQSIDLLEWEKIEQDITNGKHTYRAKVPGGWIIRFLNTMAHPQDTDYLMIQDPEHQWGLPQAEVKKAK